MEPGSVEQTPGSQTVTLMKIGYYKIGRNLGSGTFGKVKYGEHIITGTKVAIKILNRKRIKNLEMVNKIKREITNLKLFKHPHIIKLYQVISTPTDIFMVMEYASGGELFEYIKMKGKLKEAEARRFFQQIISGVDYCHRHMVVHRDLKPENLLLDHNHHIKIADFGLSNIMVDGEFLHTSCGSPNYAAPEVISGKLYAGPEVDVWSCGVILYTLLCGTLPFEGEHVPTLFKKIHCKKNEWFQKDLPAYLFPPSYEHDISVISEEALQEVCEKFQVEPAEVKTALMSEDPHNQLSIAYHLIVDNKRFSDASALHNIKDFYGAPSPPPVQSPPSIFSPTESGASKPHPERIQPLRERPFTAEKGPGRTTPAKRARWHLGIRSHSKPHEIMSEVYKAMKVLSFEWKVITDYNIHVRHKNPKTGNLVYMSLQLYQVDYRSHLLDFMVINYPDSSDKENHQITLGEGEEGTITYKGGHYVMEFFEMCAALITELAR